MGIDNSPGAGSCALSSESSPRCEDSVAPRSGLSLCMFDSLRASLVGLGVDVSSSCAYLVVFRLDGDDRVDDSFGGALSFRDRNFGDGRSAFQRLLNFGDRCPVQPWPSFGASCPFQLLLNFGESCSCHVLMMALTLMDLTSDSSRCAIPPPREKSSRSFALSASALARRLALLPGGSPRENLLQIGRFHVDDERGFDRVSRRELMAPAARCLTQDTVLLLPLPMLRCLLWGVAGKSGSPIISFVPIVSHRLFHSDLHSLDELGQGNVLA